MSLHKGQSKGQMKQEADVTSCDVGAPERGQAPGVDGLNPKKRGEGRCTRAEEVRRGRLSSAAGDGRVRGWATAVAELREEGMERGDPMALVTAPSSPAVPGPAAMAQLVHNPTAQTPPHTPLILKAPA